MADTAIRPGIYQHFKGKTYTVYGVATDATNPEPGDLPGPPKVVYKQNYEPHRLCYRALGDFTEVVDRPEHAYQGPRFVFIRPL